MKKIKQFWDKLKQRIKNKLGEKRTARLKKALKIGRIVKNVVCWILIAILTVAIIIFMVTKISGGTPSVFGYSLHRIISGSMEPEFEIGDVIVNKAVSDPSEVTINDVITFEGDSRFDNQKVTHRVIVAPYDDGRGNTILVTKGDANEKDDGEINFNTVESKYLSKVNFFKDIYAFFFSRWGLLVFIVLLLLVFFDEIVNIVRLTVGHAGEAETESFQEIVVRLTREQLEENKKKEAAERTESSEQGDMAASDETNQEVAQTNEPPQTEELQPQEEAEEMQTQQEEPVLQAEKAEKAEEDDDEPEKASEEDPKG